MLDDLYALVEFAQAGSIAGASDRLFRTPSAITRQLQRLEAELGAELLDRSVKPPRLNSLGSRVLEQARELLQRMEALKSLERLAAENISASACDLRELTRDHRVHLRVAVADAERGRAAIRPPSVPSDGISTVPVDTCVTASCFAANRLIARTREASFEASRWFIRFGSRWHSDSDSWEVRFTIPLISAS